jgi:hypothetical protein
MNKCKPDNISDAGLGICPRADKRADHECAVAGAVRSCAPSCCWPGAQLEPQENVKGQLVRAAVDDLRHGGAHLLEVASFTRQLAYQGLHTQQKITYSGRTKYSASVSKLRYLLGEYLRTQKTQGAAVFFYSAELGRENDFKL